MSPNEAEDQELTIEVLARHTGVTTRTIRFYRQSGLVPPPTRVGRRAVYGTEQIERLRLISSLREQGLSLEAIGRRLGEVREPSAPVVQLGRIGEEVRSLWDRDQAGELTAPEILEIVAPAASAERAAQTMAQLETFDVIRRTTATRRRDIGDGVLLEEALFHVPSLGTLDLGGRLLAAGVSPDLAYAAWTAMQQWLRPLATDLVKLFSRHTRAELEQGLDPDEITSAAGDLVPIALRAVQMVFTAEIEQALDELVAAGEAPAWLRNPDPH